MIRSKICDSAPTGPSGAGPTAPSLKTGAPVTPMRLLLATERSRMRSISC
jgi:hypothetical protein